MRMGSKPGSRSSLGTQDKTVGYDVTYRYEGTEQTIRMDQKPGDRLPVIDGQVVTPNAAAGGVAERGRANCPRGKPRGRSDPAPFSYRRCRHGSPAPDNGENGRSAEQRVRKESVSAC